MAQITERRQRVEQALGAVECPALMQRVMAEQVVLLVVAVARLIEQPALAMEALEV
jgi:hypothetical protein